MKCSANSQTVTLKQMILDRSIFEGLRLDEYSLPEIFILFKVYNLGFSSPSFLQRI